MKSYTEEQVDAIIKLKFGKLVTAMPPVSYVSNQKLGKLFKCSATHIYRLYTARFNKIKRKEMPLLQIIRQAQNAPPR